MGTLGFLTGLDPASVSPSDLVDAVIASERLLAHVNAVQMRLLAELGRPQRCGDVTALVSALVHPGGHGRGADVAADDAAEGALVAELTRDRSISVAAAELAAVLDWAPTTAKIRINQATRLLTALPATFTALHTGKVDVGRARMICDHTAVLTPTACTTVETRILPMIKGRSKARLETLVEREVILADPHAAEHRRRKATADRAVIHRVDKNGIGIITALLPAQAAVQVFTLIDLIAQAHHGIDGRTVDQRRADAIADIADELLTHGYLDLDTLTAAATANQHTAPEGAGTAPKEDGTPVPEGNRTPVPEGNRTPVPEGNRTPVPEGNRTPVPEGNGTAPGTDARNPPGPTDPTATRARSGRALSRHGRRPHLIITGAVTTLAGLDDLPGHLDGHGVITAPLLRAIAASWGAATAVALDPTTGTATHLGALTYRPTQPLTDQILTLHGTCRAAGCRQPAWRCELDHLVPYDHTHPSRGGPTTLHNLIPLCKFHHLLKHHTGWTPHLEPDMSITWTTNTGHTATSHPRQHTLPHEWDQPGHPNRSTEADHHHPDPEHDQPGNPHTGHNPAHHDPTGPADPADPAGPAEVADPAAPTGPGVITGPTVTGPTIPVIPAGTEYHEPHTDLEDPDTIPHPGSVDIHHYRAQRNTTRQYALGRITRITAILNRDPLNRDPRLDPQRRHQHLTEPTELDDPTTEPAPPTQHIPSANPRPIPGTRPYALKYHPDHHPSHESPAGPTALPLDPPF